MIILWILKHEYSNHLDFDKIFVSIVLFYSINLNVVNIFVDLLFLFLTFLFLTVYNLYLYMIYSIDVNELTWFYFILFKYINK